MSATSAALRQQTCVGAGTLLVGALMAYGACFISSDAGYAGIGPNAMPWFVAVVLMLCGLWLIWEARSGGYREMEAPSGAVEGDWRAAAFVIAGVVANAALITVIGFILASAFSTIVVFAQELMPGNVGMISGLFFGFAFGAGGIGAALLGGLADWTSISFVYQVCAFLPALGLLTWLLPDIDRKPA